MSDLLAALRNLCLLRIGPQDLPYAPGLLGTVVGLNLLLDGMVGWLLGQPAEALAASMISLGVILGGLWLLLALRDLKARFMQAGLALTGAALMFSVLAMPIRALLSPMPTEAEQLSALQSLALLLLVGLGGWSLAVTAHVLRHALERRFLVGFLLALTINFSVALLLQVAGLAGAP